MLEHIKVSIIIPVYNVEKFVGKCLKSVEEQTYSAIEVIIVNDGSTDNSYQIVEQYVDKNDNFSSYTIENRGLGGARNYGLQKANGEFVFFLDSDDYIAPNCIEKLLTKAIKDNSDIAICNIEDVSEDGRVIWAYRNKYKNNPTTIYQEPTILFNRPNAWGKLYKRKLFQHMEFVSREWYEDMRLIPKLYLKASKISYVDDSLIYYLQRKGSIMNSSNLNRNLEIIEAFEDLINYYKKEGVYQEFKEELEFLVIEHVAVAAVSRVARARKEEGKDIIIKMEEYLQTFEDLYENRYLSSQTINRKIILACNRRKWYGLTACLLNLKGRLK